jgi:hypothetical protein
MSYALTLALAVLIATPVAAQQVDIEKPAPPPVRIEREPEVISPGLSNERRPIEADNHPKGGRVPHEPGFIRGLSTRTATGRAGIAGWTSPNPPVGGGVAGWSEVNGWFAIGFSVTWDGPPPPPAKRPAP